MKTNTLLSIAFKIVGVIFFLKTLILIPTMVPLFYNIIKTTSLEAFLPLLMVAFANILALGICILLVIYSDQIANYLIKSNDQEISPIQNLNVNDILYICIQLFVIFLIINSVTINLKLASTGFFWLFNQELLREYLDAKTKVEFGSSLIGGILLLLSGVVLFLLSNKITAFLGRFYRKQ